MNVCIASSPKGLRQRLEALLAVDQTSRFGEMMSVLCAHLVETEEAMTEELLALAEDVRQKPEAYHQGLWHQECKRFVLTGMPRRVHTASEILTIDATSAA